MEQAKAAKKRVSVILSERDHTRLTGLARESGRTAPGYLRWLLHRAFEAEDQGKG